jgi:hypothetical protein
VKVSKKAERHAGPTGECFYCQQKVGEHHKDTCVLIHKKVKLQVTIEYEVSVPASWDPEMIEDHRHESSWCADNAIEELQKYTEDNNTCLCHHATFKHIEDIGEKYLEE